MHSSSPTASYVGRQEKNVTQIVNQAGPLPESVTRNATPAASQKIKCRKTCPYSCCFYRKPEDDLMILSSSPCVHHLQISQIRQSEKVEPPGMGFRLDGILASPLPGSRLILRPVCLVHVCDLRNERVIGVGVGQHRADREQDYRAVSLDGSTRRDSRNLLRAYLWRWSGLGTTGLAECPSRCFHCC
jgi:hypothetical protein